MKTGHLEGQEGQGREASRASLRPHSWGLQHRLLEALGRCHLRKSRQDCRVTIPALPCGAEIYNAERLRGPSTVPSSRACMYERQGSLPGPRGHLLRLPRSKPRRPCVRAAPTARFKVPKNQSCPALPLTTHCLPCESFSP